MACQHSVFHTYEYNTYLIQHNADWKLQEAKETNPKNLSAAITDEFH